MKTDNTKVLKRELVNTSLGVKLPILHVKDFLLRNEPGSEQFDHAPHNWREGIVCISDATLWESAIYCADQDELDSMRIPDGTRKTWLYIPRAKEAWTLSLAQLEEHTTE